MPKSKSTSNELEQQRIQETKTAKTTTGPGETSVKSGIDSSRSNDQRSSSQSKQSPNSSSEQRGQEEEPGDLNEV